VALQSLADVAEGVIQVSVKAKMSMLQVSARSEIAIYQCDTHEMRASM